MTTKDRTKSLLKEFFEDVLKGLTAVHAVLDHEVFHLLCHLFVQANLEEASPAFEVGSGLIVLFKVDCFGCDVEVFCHFSDE